MYPHQWAVWWDHKQRRKLCVLLFRCRLVGEMSTKTPKKKKDHSRIYHACGVWETAEKFQTTNIHVLFWSTAEHWFCLLDEGIQEHWSSRCSMRLRTWLLPYEIHFRTIESSIDWLWDYTCLSLGLPQEIFYKLVCWLVQLLQKRKWIDLRAAGSEESVRKLTNTKNI